MSLTKYEFRPPQDCPEPDHDEIVRHINHAIHHINDTIRRGIEAGVSVELIRTSRCHDGCGNWGDQMSPVIRKATLKGEPA